jgi:hypothetical protein
MTQFAYATDPIKVYKSSTKRLVEPFIPAMYAVFNSLELLLPLNDDAIQDRPSVETINWAKEVLLRILPRKFLVGAIIDAFEKEIHVSWENEDHGKRVVVFFPAPKQLKIYHESVRNNKVVEHKLVNATSPLDIADRLRWFFQ